MIFVKVTDINILSSNPQLNMLELFIIAKYPTVTSIFHENELISDENEEKENSRREQGKKGYVEGKEKEVEEGEEEEERRGPS